jgi:hypothetical protein
MSTPRRSWSAALAVAALLGSSMSLPALAQEEEGSLGPDSSSVIPLLGAKPADLLAPIGPVLSGRAWLMTEQLDPGFGDMPTSDPITGPDLEGGAGSSSPRMQAASAGAPVPYREPGPAFSRNILVTRDFGTATFQTEPSITANPEDPEHLVLGVIDYSFPSMSSYVSYDGGELWEGPFQVPYLQEDLAAGGDPVVAFDRDSNVYMSYISIGTDDFELGPVEITAEVSSIAVARSEDDGFTWPVQISSARSRVDTADLTTDRFGRLRGTVDISFLDKPWMTVGPDPKDAEKDVIYVTYTDFDVSYDILYIGEIPNLLPTEMRSTIRLVSSSDGGQTWTDPVAVSPTVRRAFSETSDGSQATGVYGTLRTVQGSQPSVTPDGVVHVAWMDSTDDDSQKGAGEIWASSSSDAGRTWTAPVVAASFNEVEFRPRSAYFRFWASAFPQIASGPDGEVYIAYTARPSDKPNDDGDIFLVSSFDGGTTWSRPKVVNDDDTDHVQFFPAIDVDPAGAVHIMWGDMRDDPHQTRYHIYYTRSDDQGKTFGFVNEDLGLRAGDTRVTDFPSNPNYAFVRGLFIGDYFSIVATEDDVHLAWADSRLGEFGPINQKIAVARTKAVKAPEIFLNPPSGPGGQQVTIQGFDFQPDMDVYLQLGDSTISTLRTDVDGGFQATVYMPITSQGSQTVTAFDESGNGASSSFFTEFGFGDIQDLLKDLGDRLGTEGTTGSPGDGNASGSPSPGSGAEASPSPSSNEG